MRNKSFKKGDVATLLLLCIILIVLRLYSPNYKKFTFVEYVVNQDDTLWQIAREQCPGEDPREIVYLIRERNNITPIIRPGQVIEIPVKAK